MRCKRCVLSFGYHHLPVTRVNTHTTLQRSSVSNAALVETGAQQPDRAPPEGLSQQIPLVPWLALCRTARRCFAC